MNLKNKIAIVTGASRGIGKAIAEIFVERGALVIGTATTQEKIFFINTFLKKNGKGMKLNYLEKNSISLFLEEFYKEFRKVDILVNNAGITCDKLLINMNEKEWKSVINVNLNSIFYMSKSIVRSMLKNRYGRIITIGSVVGNIGNFGQTNYSASKSGLIGFSKSLAKEVAPYGITVNMVSPGFISTDMTKNIEKKNYYQIISKIPLNRLGDPKEVATVVAFLASEESSYVTGETIHVNGGMYMS